MNTIKMNGWLVAVALIGSLGFGCNETKTETETGKVTTGKADGESCEIGSYEFRGECQDPFQICLATDGVLDDDYCMCPDGGVFKLAFGCVSAEQAETLCTSSDGIWSVGENQFICECPAETALDDHDGQCKDWITMCIDTGGLAHDDGCNCGPDKTFYLATNGCTDHVVAQYLCESSDGVWGDVSGYDETTPGPAQACTCLDISYLSDWTGRCTLPKADNCEETGGTEFDWGCFCGADSYYVSEEGGCIANDAAQNLCEGSEGTWTETPNFEEASLESPTQRNYCACTDSFFEATEGVCKTL